MQARIESGSRWTRLLLIVAAALFMVVIASFVTADDAFAQTDGNTTTIELHKISYGGVGTFNFSAQGALVSNFSLTTAPLAGFDYNSAETTFGPLPAGTYVFEELLPLSPGWDFVDLQCRAYGTANVPSTYTIVGRQVTIELESGSNVVCAFANTLRGALTVQKVINWNGTTPDSTLFEVCITGPTEADPANRVTLCSDPLGHQDTYTFQNLVPGTYNVTETDPGAGWSVSGEGPVTVESGDTGECCAATITNTRQQAALSVRKTIAASYNRDWDWTVNKTADPLELDLFDGQTGAINYTVSAVRSGPFDTDHLISGEVRITNNSATQPVVIDSIVDVLSDGTPVTLVGAGCAPTAQAPTTLAAGATLVCAYSIDTDGRPNPKPAVFNRVTVGVTAAGVNDIVYDTGVVVWTRASETDATLTVNDTNGDTFEFPLVGGATSEEYDRSILCEQFNGITYDANGNSLDHVVENTITWTDDGQEQTDTETVDVDCYQLRVTKTATPRWERRFEWTIDKVIDPAGPIVLYEDEQVTLNYTIDVVKDAGTAQNWSATGTVTVNNPNPESAATLQSLTDLLDGSPLALNCGGPLVVPAGGSLPCTYNTGVLPDGDTIVNVATAVLYGVPQSGDATINFSSVNPVLINNSINVDDLGDLTGSQTFGPFSATGGSDYSYEFLCSEHATYTNGRFQGLFSNTATIRELPEQNDEASIDITCLEYGEIVVVKQTQPAGAAGSFAFTTSYAPGSFSLSHGQSNRSGNLLPGTYSVAETVPAGWRLLTATCSDGSQPGSISLANGETVTCTFINTSTNTQLVSLGDRVWEDINPAGTTTPEQRAGDGLQNSAAEVGVPGVTVQLWSPGLDGAIGGEDDVMVDETVTGADGTYLFTGLPVGQYYLVFIKPAGSTAWFDVPNVGDDRTIDSDVTVDVGDANRAVTELIEVDGDTLDWDAAIIDTSAAASSDLGDRVWLDAVDPATRRGNGIQDAGEAGVRGVQVQLYRVDAPAIASATDTLVGTQTTDASGNYLFVGLDPGTYYLVFQIPANHSVSPQGVGEDDGVDSDIDATGRTGNIVLPDFTVDLRWDAGVYVTPTSRPDDPEPEVVSRTFLPFVGR